MAKIKKENEVIKSKTTPRKSSSVSNKESSSKKIGNTKSSVKITHNEKSNTQIKPKKEILKKKEKGLVLMYNKLIKLFKKNKKVSISILSIIVVIVLAIVIIPIISLNQKMITIDGNNYTKSDFMIYFYSVKYNYFGKDNINNIPEATLNTKIDDTSNKTIKEYLNDKVVTELKTATAIKKIAEENNIQISHKEEEELKKEKEKYINSLGGSSKFKKFLKENNTTEKSYDEMSKNDKLYTLIFNEIYAENKKNDLTEEEKSKAKIYYNTSYKRIRQIVLSTIDIDTKKSLNETIINQKEALANTILNEAKNGEDFDTLIKKYSEDAIKQDPPYYIYYKNGQLLEEVEKAVNNLSVGDISDVIKTKYAFHIIKKDELDDSRLSVIYDEKREEKLIKSISEMINKSSVIYHVSIQN